MNFSAACPSCGAALDIAEQTARVVCPFCGTQFELDLSDANPEFRKNAPRAAAAEVFVPKDDDIFTPPVAGSDSGAPYTPSQPDVFSSTPQQTFDIPFISQAAGRLVSTRLWFALAIATLVVFCVSCLCLLAVVRLVFGYAINF